MEDSKTHYYVQVNEPDSSEYYVGPFEEGGDSFSHGRAAIDWVYRQVGLLKVAYPDAQLIKDKWHYQESAHGFEDPTVEVALVIAGYRMEIKILHPPAFKNLIQEEIAKEANG